MQILSRVCADFYDKQRNRIYRITKRDLGLFLEAPESIRQDPLFQMLVDDGSIKFPADTAKDKALEQDPFAGADATGKEIKPKTARAKRKTKAEAETAANPQDTSSALRAPSPEGEGLSANGEKAME